MPFGIVLLLVWLVLLVRFPRLMLPATGILIGIAVLLAAGVGINQWRHDQRVSQIEISIHYAPDSCDFGKPLQVHINNPTSRTISQLDWQISATQPGYNTNLVNTRNVYQIDQPLQNKEQWQQCYALPPLRSGYRATDLAFHAEQVHANFQH